MSDFTKEEGKNEPSAPVSYKNNDNKNQSKSVNKGKEIVVDLSKSFYSIIARSPTVLNTNPGGVEDIKLNVEYIYQIAITDSSLSFDDSNIIKPIGAINEKLEILNIKKTAQGSIVVIKPRINGYTLKDGVELGRLF